MSQCKLLEVSTAKFSERVRKEKVKLPSYRELLKLHVRQIQLVDSDEDEQDAQQRKKVQDHSLQTQKRVRDKAILKTPKKSALEQQLTKFLVYRVTRPKTTASPQTKRTHHSSSKHLTICKKEHHPQVFSYTNDSPIIVNNALRQSNKKSLPKNIKCFLSDLRFNSTQLQPSKGLDLQIDSHLAPFRPNTTFLTSRSRQYTIPEREIRTALTFDQLQTLVSKRLAINYKK